MLISIVCSKFKPKNIILSLHSKIVHDKFCWYCHLRCLKGCSTCVRSFHKKCQQKYYEDDIITDSGDNADSAVVCEVCKTIEGAKESFKQK